MFGVRRPLCSHMCAPQVFAVLPFVGFIIVYFLFAADTQRQSIRFGILVTPVAVLIATLFLFLCAILLRPSSSFWKTGVVRAITSAYTRGHKEGISTVLITDKMLSHDYPVLITAGREDGRIKVSH